MRPKTKATPGAEALLDSWAAHIDDLLDSQWDLMGGGHHWHPHPDSPLETVRTLLRKKFGPTGTWDGAEAGQAGVLATLFLATSGQHLEGIRALLLAREVVRPLAPLARSIGEAAGRTFWLVDPRLGDARDLAARVWMARLEDATRRVTTAKLLDNLKVLEGLVKVKKHLRDEAIPARFYDSEIDNDNGEITLRDQRLPGLSGSLKHIAAGMDIEDWHTPMYAFLSDATHPTPYAALETLQAAEDSDDEDLHQFGSADMRREYMIFQAAVHAYQQSWLVTTSYYGLDTAPVIDVCDKVNDVPKPAGPEDGN